MIIVIVANFLNLGLSRKLEGKYVLAKIETDLAELQKSFGRGTFEWFQ
jgi:hypothetical protein